MRSELWTRLLTGRRRFARHAEKALRHGLRLVTAVMLALALAATASAHGGGLDKDGCHTNRKTGDYHCHRPASQPRRSPFLPALDASAASGAGRRGVFRNCAEARAAGADPVYRGDPGYGSHLDRDNDGVGCEPYGGRRAIPR